MLDTCYNRSEDLTEKMITIELSQLKNVTCLDLAIMSEQREYVSHCGVQGLISDVWTGPLTKNVRSRDVVLAFFCPLLLQGMEFAKVMSKEESKGREDVTAM